MLQTPVLAYYDTSESALGAVLLQEGRPIALCVPQTSRIRAQLGANREGNVGNHVQCTEVYREYILGKTTAVQTDHKPLETILCKPMSAAPLRLLAMILKVRGYDRKVEYLSGKK